MGITTGFVIFSIALCISGIIAVIISTKKGSVPAGNNTPAATPAATSASSPAKNETRKYHIVRWILCILVIAVIVNFVIDYRKRPVIVSNHSSTRAQKIYLEQNVWSDYIQIPRRTDVLWYVDQQIPIDQESEKSGTVRVNPHEQAPHEEYGNWIRLKSPATDVMVHVIFTPK